MIDINIKLDIPLAMMVAMSKGWTPTIEDTSQELVEDSYPMIPNPVTFQMFLSVFIPEFIKEYVLQEGRKKLIDEFTSTSETVFHKVKTGVFDDSILLGDFEGIKTAVKSNL